MSKVFSKRWGQIAPIKPPCSAGFKSFTLDLSFINESAVFSNPAKSSKAAKQ